EVADVEQDLAALGRGRLDDDPLAGEGQALAGVDGVGDEVGQHLAEPARVAVEVGQVGRETELELPAGEAQTVHEQRLEVTLEQPWEIDRRGGAAGGPAVGLDAADVRDRLPSPVLEVRTYARVHA